MGIATKYLGALHGFIIAVALAYTGVAIYILVEGTNYLPAAASQLSWATYTPIAFGITILIVAVLSCFCVTLRQNKGFTIFFALLQLFFGTVVVAAGASLYLVSTEYIGTIASASVATTDVPAGQMNAQKDFSDFMLGLYVGCCTSPVVPLCTMGTVASGNSSYCHEKANVYENGVETGVASINSYCALSSVNATCGDISEFLAVNEDLLTEFVGPSGIAFAVFGALLILAFIASCVIIVTGRGEEGQVRA